MYVLWTVVWKSFHPETLINSAPKREGDGNQQQWEAELEGSISGQRTRKTLQDIST